MEAASRMYRTVATGFCFAIFGAGGVIVALAILPLLLLLPWPSRRHRLGRLLVHHLFRLFVALMIVVGVMRLVVHGADSLRGSGHLILANHPSLIDVVILMSLVDRPDCIVKDRLWSNIFTAGAVRAAGFLSNQSGPELIQSAVASVRSGNNLIIFPEGTRTAPNKPMRFQRGAAYIAAYGLIDITPVVFSVSEPTLTKGFPWYRVPRRRPTFRLDVLRTLRTEQLLESNPSSVGQGRRLTKWLEDFFSAQVEIYGRAAE